ncbi:tRNA (adenosine(37)-N6)-threonylcarbamoyltransferase complex dimerization subunit type 1 TsaB [Moraxella sp. Tifton1]|uniref:tRNA (adenosine(37)-N6)-threonylcarbamoyltransferase complex dimerization subunit type 1 TsaB n=1 Tax=Moraxella oculi TaxID=2940516 RepID=UPI0020113DC2|nr:tRNA (adenosine(37)-N6)-threonylcarbamoyltransferase complex dimerization subunit type 1 TsaB [Moraxella sp. Tifton1]MCL1622672.1 tRNA (adenosine(37)-N6)-threonylcarbamoyltransferase complex dimerization subunit type 1 TsaB [Moraxella sp. Tifton1]
MKILALDTVFEQCSVAILQDDQLIAEQTTGGNRGQTEVILPMIDALLKDNALHLDDMDCLAFNRGPGAFSGIRINTAVVQALSFACGLPCVGVSGLRALAQKAFVDEGLNRVYSVLDARMNELYFGEFMLGDDGIMNVVGDEGLLPYHSVMEDGLPIIGKDEHIALIQAQDNVICPVNYPTAFDIGRIAHADFLKQGGVAAQQALPVYLRHNAWKTLVEQGKA